MRAGDAAVVEALAASGEDVNSRDAHGQTALMLAAMLGHAAVVATLIRRGADLNVSAKYKLTALMLAVINGHEEIARMLAAAGADVTLRGAGAPGFFDKTAGDLASERGDVTLASLLRVRGEG